MKFFGLNNKSPTYRRPVRTKSEANTVVVERIREQQKSVVNQEPKTVKTKAEHIDHKKEFLKIFDKLKYQHNAYEVWNDFVTMFACSISNAVDKTHYDEREKLYLSRIKKYEDLYERNAFPQLAAEVTLALEDNPEQDFLGDIFMSLGIGNKSNGQFFTPYHIAKFMAAVTMDMVESDIDKNGYAAIHDSCCGAGVMLIAAINEAKEQLTKKNINFQNHILVTGQDIDKNVALMCYIQISLLGVAGFVKVGNALSEPMSPDDTTENYWFTPMYFSDVWVYRRMFRKIKEFKKWTKE